MCVHTCIRGGGGGKKKRKKKKPHDRERSICPGRFRGKKKKKKEYREVGGILRRRRAVAYEAQAESDHPGM